MVALVTLYLFHPVAQPAEIPTPYLPINPITIENQKPGTTSWHLTNPAQAREIEGYASLTSVNRGGEIELFVNTKEPSYTMEVFRMGWYGGAGARQLAAAITRKGIRQPPAIEDQATGLVECNWQDPYVLTIPYNPADPTQWASGVYLVKLVASHSGKQSYIIFVVRDDARPADFLFQSSVTTFQAYNNWGGKSLYRWNSRVKQAAKVSFNRPYVKSPNPAAAYGVGAGEFLTNFQPKRRTASAGWEYNMVRWLEREGYDVTYATDVDTHVNPLVGQLKPALWMHKAFLSVGHDEYWSWQMRQNVETARDRGVSLGFFSSNTCYWQIRFEPSRLTKASNRTIVTYKEQVALDPFVLDGEQSNNYRVTTRWRDHPVDLPEDALIGVGYETFQVNADIILDRTAPDWLISGTSLDLGHTSNKASLKEAPSQIRLPGLLGYEVDRMLGHAPANTVRVAHSPYQYKGGRRYADMTVYTTTAGSKVFATGSMQWSWGLDDFNAPQLRPALLSADAQQITRNVLASLVSN